MSTKRIRTTYAQLEAMVNYLEQNKELLLNKGSKKKSEKWLKLCHILNIMGRGPVKSTKEWKRVLIEWKYNTKRRLKTNINGKRLSNAEKRLIKLLSEIPNEDIDPSEIHFIQALVEKNSNENLIKTLKIVPIENEEFQYKNDVEEKHLKELEQKSKTELLPSTSNFIEVIKEQLKERSKIVVKNNDPPKNGNENCNNRPIQIKRRQFKRTSNFAMIRRSREENTKSNNLLAKSMLKLAESNCKVAESNCRIAESNGKLAEAIKLYGEAIKK